MMNDKTGAGRPKIHKTKKELESAQKSWNKKYKAKKIRIDMLVDPDIHERWTSYLEKNDVKREEALSNLLKKSGF